MHGFRNEFGMTQKFFLFYTRQFTPLLITQFLGAFNDNLFKNVFLVSVIFGTGVELKLLEPKIFITLAAGLFIFPYVLCSSLAGQLADKLEKSKLVLRIKLAELVLMLLAVLGFYLSNAWILLTVLVGMGAQSAFFSPLKYSLVPDHLPEEKVLSGNALLEASTFLSILTGTITGGLLVGVENGIWIASTLLIILAGVGILSAWFIPPAGPYAAHTRLNWNIMAETGAMLRSSFADPVLGRAILGISWFWLLGSVFLSQFPAYGKDYLGGDESVVTVLLTAFSLGIGIGSFLADHLLKGAISTRFSTISLIVMTVFIGDVYFATPLEPLGASINAAEFFNHWQHWRIVIDLTFVAIAGGVFIVPLMALLQTQAGQTGRGRVIATNNIVNAFFMFAASGLAAVGLASGLPIPLILLVAGIGNLFVILLVRKMQKAKQNLA